MKWRPLVASVGLGILVTGGLTACQTKIGTAAVVGSSRVSESQVSSYVRPGGPSSKSGQQQSSPRAQALTYLVREQLFTTALAHSGGVPGNSQLAALHDEAAGRFITSGISGPQLDKFLRGRLQQLGFTSSFAGLVLRTAELGDAYVNRVKAASFADLIKRLRRFTKTVNVSPRYGGWDPTQLQVTTANGRGAPSFVHFGSAAPTAG